MAEDKTLLQKFAEAWGKMENPPLDGANPHFNNRFATLKATLAEVRKVCAPMGLAYVQTVNDGFLVTMVTDGEDEMQLSKLPLPAVPDPQRQGSQFTYAKRQVAQMDWGIVGEEDDDAEAATKGKRAPSQGAFDAHCASCGLTYHFADQAQYAQWIAQTKGAHSMPGGKTPCPNPDWQING